MLTSNLLPSAAVAAPGLTTVQGSGAMKASILVFDSRPGTRSFVPTVTGKYRVAVGGGGSVGGGGYAEYFPTLTAGSTYNYTVGAAGIPGTSDGGTSSFNAVISATGGANGSAAAGGAGSGGVTNTSGGAGSTTSGGASGHRFGNGAPGINNCGAGWSQSGGTNNGGAGGVDGFGLGLIPGLGGTNCNTTTFGGTNGGYGAGGGVGTNAGIGGGGGTNAAGGIGMAGLCGGTAFTNPGVAGNGVVIVELIG